MSCIEETHNCIFCNESFMDKESLQVHFRKHGDPQFKKESPKKSNTPEDAGEPETTAEKKAELISCDVCDEVFPTISKAITHKHKVHPDHDVKYFCCWCGKLFTLKHLYNKHLTSHGSEKRGSGNIYHCDCCNVNFNVPSAMMYHNKVFHRQDTELVSIGQSTKQKLVDQELCQLYYCAFCGEEYINKVNLHKHITDDHCDENQSPNEVLRCPLCQSIFYHLDAYEVHLTFHSSEDLYNNSEISKTELSEFTLDSVPPITEKVEDDETEKETKSPSSMDIDQLLQMASEGETTKKHKKHKKHKKTKNNAITLDEFLTMNTDVFGEGLDFQGAEEVPTQVVSKRLKVKGKPQAAPGGKVIKKELDKLKLQGIVVKKNSNKVPVFPGVKAQLGMQNKMQRTLKIAPCALKPITNPPKTGIVTKVVTKTNEEVISKLLHQSHNQIQIRKKPGPSNGADSNKRSTTPENIEVECDLLVRSSEPSSELDPDDNMEEWNVGAAHNPALPGPLSQNIKESDVDSKIISDKTGEFGKIKGCDENSITQNEELNTRDTNSLEVLKNIQYLSIKQLNKPSNKIPEPCIINTPEKKIDVDADFEDAIPCSKIINITPPKCAQVSPNVTEEKSNKNCEIISNKIIHAPFTSPVTPFKAEVKQDIEKNNSETVCVKPKETQEKQDVIDNTGKEVSNIMKNIGQQISIKPVSTVGNSQKIKNTTTDKSKAALKNLSKHITIKSIHAKSNDTEDNSTSAVRESVTTTNKIIPMSQGNIKHFPQITVTSLSTKANEEDEDELFDEFDSDPDNISPIKANPALNKTDNNPHQPQPITASKNVFEKKSTNVLNNTQITIKSSNKTPSASTSSAVIKGSYDEDTSADRAFSDFEDELESKQGPITLSDAKQILQGRLNKNLVIKPTSSRVDTEKKTSNVLNTKQLTIKSKTQTPSSSTSSAFIKESYDKDTFADRDLSDFDDEADLESEQGPLTLPDSKQILQRKLNKNVIIKPTTSRENTVELPNGNKAHAANDSQQSPKQIDLLQKLKKGITIKTLPKSVPTEPEIFNVDDSDSEDAEKLAIPAHSNQLHSNRPNVVLVNNNTASPIQANMKKENDTKKIHNIQHNRQQFTESESIRQNIQLVKRTAQPVVKSDDDDDFFSTDEEEQHKDMESEQVPDICPNVSKLLSNKNISFKNMKASTNQALKQTIPASIEHMEKVNLQSGLPKSELLKDFHFDESSEEDSTSPPTTGKEVALIKPDEPNSDVDNFEDDDNFGDMNEHESFLMNQNQSVLNKLKSINANLSIKSNSPNRQILNKNVKNVREDISMKSSSHHNNQTVTCTQSRAMKRDATELFSVRTNRNDAQRMHCKQVKLVDEGLQPENPPNQQLIKNMLNQEVTTSVKTIKTKTVVQEITTTVTRTIKTVNEEVSAQVTGNAAVTNAPRMPNIIQGMTRTPTQLRHPGTPFRQRAPANTVNFRPATPTRPSMNTAIRSPNNRMRPPGTQQIRPGTSRMPVKKALPVQTNQTATRPIKISPNVLMQKPQQPSMKRVSEPTGHFSCFKKPNESLFPEGDSVAVASTSNISRTNYNSSTKTVKSGGAFVTATKTTSEVHSSHQEFNKLNNLSGLKVVRSSSTQAVKEVQKIEVNDPKRQSTLEAIKRLQKQGLLMKKPRLEEPDECEESDSGCEDIPNLAIEDGGG